MSDDACWTKRSVRVFCKTYVYCVLKTCKKLCCKGVAGLLLLHIFFIVKMQNICSLIGRTDICTVAIENIRNMLNLSTIIKQYYIFIHEILFVIQCNAILIAQRLVFRTASYRFFWEVINECVFVLQTTVIDPYVRHVLSDINGDTIEKVAPHFL